MGGIVGGTKLNKLFKTRKIRIIELFAGFGSQSLTLKYIGVPFEHYRISEWAIKSIQAYKDLHFSNDDTDYSSSLTKQEVKSWLYDKISSNYNSPMSKEQIDRLPEKQARRIYNNMIATNNLGSICKVCGNDLGIVETDKYCYIVTYSFPCQDLSIAGKGAGMAKGGGTRSGLLWEVERLLLECDNLPQVLVMENVPNILSLKNIANFVGWQNTLNNLGYTSKVQILNSKDYGVPQNRKRCFMVSVLGNYDYIFPKERACNLCLKDILQDNVDEKYYLPETDVLAVNK